MPEPEPKPHAGEEGVAESDKDELDDVLASGAESDEKQLSCCGQEFGSRQEYDTHQRETHAGEKESETPAESPSV